MGVSQIFNLRHPLKFASVEAKKNHTFLSERWTIPLQNKGKCGIILFDLWYLRGIDRGISYKKRWVLLIEKDITRAQMRRDLKIATGTMSKLNKGEEVALSVILRICEYLDCDIGDICSVVNQKKEDTV
jgi:DNA-binding Xre family transcriptional regulator